VRIAYAYQIFVSLSYGFARCYVAMTTATLSHDKTTLLFGTIIAAIGVNPGDGGRDPQILKWGSWRGVGGRGGCGFRSFSQ
jgi:hypothetical protein